MEERNVGPLRFVLDLSQPIYEQLVQQLSGTIVRGDLDLGEKIPSVRDLAQGLKAAPNTVVHAYQELERERLIETRRGQGTFVTTSTSVVQEFQARLAQEFADQFLQQMARLGFSLTEIHHLLENQGRDKTWCQIVRWQAPILVKDMGDASHWTNSPLKSLATELWACWSQWPRKVYVVLDGDGTHKTDAGTIRVMGSLAGWQTNADIAYWPDRARSYPDHTVQDAIKMNGSGTRQRTFDPTCHPPRRKTRAMGSQWHVL